MCVGRSHLLPCPFSGKYFSLRAGFTLAHLQDLWPRSSFPLPHHISTGSTLPSFSLLPACPVTAHHAGFSPTSCACLPTPLLFGSPGLAATYSTESPFSPWPLRPSETQSPPACPAEFSTLGSGHLMKENSEELTPSVIPHLSSRHSQEPPSNNTLLLLLSSHPHKGRRGYTGAIRGSYPLPTVPAALFPHSVGSSPA